MQRLLNQVPINNIISLSHRTDRGLRVSCGGMGLRWLSRFKLIRLRRISLATLPRYGRRGGWRDGCQYMYCLCIACLPAGVLHSQNKERLLPASGRWSLRSQGKIIACLRQVVAALPRFKLMRRLRRRTSEGFMIGSNDMYNNDVGKGVVYAYEAYEAK